MASVARSAASCSLLQDHQGCVYPPKPISRAVMYIATLQVTYRASSLSKPISHFRSLTSVHFPRATRSSFPKITQPNYMSLPDEYLADAMPIAKKIASAQGLENYNILQNNGRIAHQEVDHVHFHVIPKPSVSDEEGLVIGWPAKKPPMDELKALHEDLVDRLSKL
ncbi:hypothetical protein F5141DRAFT_1291213 [Pisolithus sp. B1]|nr:hypothetical protein F5141DRAFT_1291213 [Pisolithus sp. B1]